MGGLKVKTNNENRESEQKNVITRNNNSRPGVEKFQWSTAMKQYVFSPHTHIHLQRNTIHVFMPEWNLELKSSF